jgi:hypothetical protein
MANSRSKGDFRKIPTVEEYEVPIFVAQQGLAVIGSDAHPILRDFSLMFFGLKLRMVV